MEKSSKPIVASASKNDTKHLALLATTLGVTDDAQLERLAGDSALGGFDKMRHQQHVREMMSLLGLSRSQVPSQSLLNEYRKMVRKLDFYPIKLTFHSFLAPNAFSVENKQLMELMHSPIENRIDFFSRAALMADCMRAVGCFQEQHKQIIEQALTTMFRNITDVSKMVRVEQLARETMFGGVTWELGSSQIDSDCSNALIEKTICEAFIKVWTKLAYLDALRDSSAADLNFIPTPKDGKNNHNGGFPKPGNNDAGGGPGSQEAPLSNNGNKKQEKPKGKGEKGKKQLLEAPWTRAQWDAWRAQADNTLPVGLQQVQPQALQQLPFLQPEVTGKGNERAGPYNNTPAGSPKGSPKGGHGSVAGFGNGTKGNTTPGSSPNACRFPPGGCHFGAKCRFQHVKSG
jgi:hypothetical protein